MVNSKRSSLSLTHLLSPTILVLMVVLVMVSKLASSDLKEDRAECTDQLLGLATCLPYMVGEAKNPTLDCCHGVKQVIDKSMKCLCILIKDRNDPSLGIKVNASLAVYLPTACHAPTPNISHCVSILHIQPHSLEAKEFESLEKKVEGHNLIDVKGNSSVAAESVKSDGGNRKRWLKVEIIYGILVSIVFHILG